LLRALTIASILLFAPALAGAEADGVDSSLSFPPVGCGSVAEGETLGCHFQDAEPTLAVTLAGPAEVPLGAFGGAFTASVPPGFAGLAGAGVNVTMDATSTAQCFLDPFDPLLRDEGAVPRTLLTHTGDADPPPENLIGKWSYDFLVVDCDVPGTLVLLAAMNVFDGDGTEEGELWNKTQLSVTVPEPAAGAPEGAAGLALAALAARSARLRTRRA
jgi:hypothetical protein